MLRGRPLQRRFVKVYKLRSSQLARLSPIKRSISVINIFKRPWTRVSRTTLIGKYRRFSSNTNLEISPVLDSGFTHKYDAWYLFAVPIAFWSLGDFVFDPHDEVAMVSWPGKGGHGYRAIFFSVLFGTSAHTVSGTLLNRTALASLIDRPLTGMVTISAKIFARGYLTGFLFMGTLAVFFTCLSFQESSKNRRDRSSQNRLYECIRRSYQTGVSLFVAAFPMFFLGALIGSPVFFMMNRSHWIQQLARVSKGTKSGFQIPLL